MLLKLSRPVDLGLRAVGLKQIDSQFLFSYLLIIVLAVGSALFLYLSMSADAQTINIAGRQRMLSQRLAKEALLVGQGVEQRDTLAKTMALFEDSHRQLLQGDHSAGIVAPASDAIATQLEKVGQLWQNYKTTINAYSAQPSQQGLIDIQRQSPQILKEMNQAVVMMSALSTAEFKQQQMLSLLMALGILLVALMSRFLGMSWLMAQIKCLQQRLEAVGQGDFSQPIATTVSDNEIGQIFKAYNTMLQQVGEMVSGVQHLAGGVKTEIGQLTGTAANAESSVARQNSELDQIATAMNQMSATIHEVANNATQAADAATAADQAARDGSSEVDQAMRQISALAQQLDNSSELMNRLDADSQQIGSVVTVINAIAEQTNLLALNAAIEAARAGEQGRGFAVVADEVRTLAQRTQASTLDIQRIIESLQALTQQAVGAMGESVSKAQDSTQLVSDARDALFQIAAAVDTIAQMNTQIATAAEQQSHVAEEMDRNITTVSSESGAVRQMAENIHATVETVDQQIRELNQLTAAFQIKA